MTIEIRIDEAVFRSFPDFSLAAFCCEGLSAALDDTVAKQADATAARSLSRMDLETLSAQPRIAAWRNAYRRMGLKPGDHRSSIEQLVRRGLRDGLLQLGIWPVDLYNRLSIAHLAPMGGYDLDKLPSPVVDVRETRAGDVFAPLGGERSTASSATPVVVYAAAEIVLCWALNHRDSQVTALQPDTRRALFVSEGADAEGAASAEVAIHALRQVIATSGARTTGIVRLDRTKPSSDIL